MKFRFNTKRSRKTVDFNDLLPEIVSDFEMSESFIIQDITSNWDTLVGGILASHSRPDRIFKNTLFIHADHSVYASELMMMKSELVEKINTSNPAASITSLKIEIKKV